MCRCREVSQEAELTSRMVQLADRQTIRALGQKDRSKGMLPWCSSHEWLSRVRLYGGWWLEDGVRFKALTDGARAGIEDDDV
jgi:hypothetical protein